MQKKRNTFLLLTVIYISFFALGLPTGAFAMAWPGVVYEMNVLVEQAGIFLMVNVVFYSLTSSQLWRIYRYLHVEKVNLIGAGIMVFSLLGLGFSPDFTVFILFSAVIGVGGGMMDTSINTYMAESFSARHINWLHGFWGMGSAVGPVIMTQMMVLLSWRAGYYALAAVTLLSFLIILASIISNIWKKEAKAMERKAAEETALIETGAACESGQPIQRRYLTKVRHQFLEVFMFFVYGSMEYSLGFWITIVLLESRGLPLEVVGMFPAVFYGGLMAGRMAFGFIAEKMRDLTMIRLGLTLSLIGVFMLVPEGAAAFGLFGVALAGAGFAPVFPCLVHDTANRFAPSLLTKLVGYEMTACALGVAVLSSLKGPVLANVSLELLFPMTIGLIVITFLCNEILERATNRLNVPCPCAQPYR